MTDIRWLKTRASVEVCAAPERMTSFFESLSFEGFEITDSPRIKRLHSDRAKEFTALCFQKLLSNHRSIYHTLTTGYDPQANGTSERPVGLMKALSARCLTTSGLPQEFWSQSSTLAQSLLCSSLQRKQRSPPFGSYGKITTTDLDTCILRYILSWAASSRFNTIASLDITAAFLNADLPPGSIAVLRPPTILYNLVSSRLALSGEYIEQFMALEKHPLFAHKKGPGSWRP